MDSYSALMRGSNLNVRYLDPQCTNCLTLFPELPCSLCPEKFVAIRDYSEHMDKIHHLKRIKKKTPASCPICLSTFAQKYTMAKYVLWILIADMSAVQVMNMCSV